MSADVLPLTPREAPQAQAGRWIARIDAGPLDAQERAELQAWLAEDPQHARLLDTHALLWSAAGAAVRSSLSPVSATSHVSPAPPAQQLGHRLHPSGWRWGSVALAGFAGMAGVAALALWAVLLVPRADGDPDRNADLALAAAATLSTAVGDHRQLALEDGSSMHLNTASAARVAFSPRHRRVVLDRGEGFFDVAKDRSRPFEVVVGRTTVRAVGTRFQVRRLADDRVEVTVFEGLVEVLKAPAQPDAQAASASVLRQPLRVGAGQLATEELAQVVIRNLSAMALEQRLAWQKDRIVFDATPLAQAVEQVNRYAPHPLRLADPALHAVTVSGSFSTQDIPVFLRSLERGFGLHVEQGPEAVLISAAGKR